MFAGKRTSTFLYPGESSSEEEEEEKKKGRNVVKRAIKSTEYSDDDFDVDYKAGGDDDDELEEGEVRVPRKEKGKEEVEERKQVEGVQITVQTQDGVVLSQEPITLVDEATGKTETLDPSAYSIVSSGIHCILLFC